jgi:hypothetical protein
MSEYLLPHQPSIGSATGTRVDSACKHHHQCRVSTDDLLQLTFPKNNQDELQRNKYRYCVHKDELVLSVGRPWDATLTRRFMNNAYPRVISNLGMIDGVEPASKVFIKMITYMNHYCRSLRERSEIIKFFKNMTWDPAAVQMPYGPLPVELRYFEVNANNRFVDDTAAWLSCACDYQAMGYAQTLGWAHPHSGDTMTTVMIGGLRTVMNGDFEIQTNDVIQWYWPFELQCFHKDGRRKHIGGGVIFRNNEFLHCNVNPNHEWGTEEDPDHVTTFKLPTDAQMREQFHDQTFGMKAGVKKMVPRIKPYIPDDVNPRLYDKVRVFAVAVGCARPHEMVDIKICRQAL